MKTTPLDAHRQAMGRPVSLETRRRINTKPLRKHSRLLDQSALGRITRECEGIATVEYYGHPSRRMLIAHPLPGRTYDETREAVKNAMVVSGNMLCGNYVFSVAG